MYDVGCTMYDLNASAPEARGNGRRRGKFVWTARMRCPEGVKTGDGCKPVWPKAQLLPRRGEES